VNANARRPEEADGRAEEHVHVDDDGHASVRPLGFILCVGLLLALELFVARTDWIWSYVPRSESGVVDALEDQVLAKTKDPRVVILGSSRARDAVSPRTLEKELKLPEGAVVNLAVSQGVPFDALVLWRRNRALLENADLVLFGLEPFQFSTRTRLTERADRFATLDERLHAFDGRDQTPLLVGWAWRTYGARESIRRALKAMFVEAPEPLKLTEDGRMIWRPKSWNKKRKARHAHDAKKFFHRWKPSEGRAEMLRTLLGIVGQGDTTVGLFQVPTRPGFWREVGRRYRDKRRKYEALVDEARGDVPVWWVWLDDEHPLKDGDFYDYGHIDDRAAQTYTRFFARHIETAFPDALSSARKPR
jgi:hypothetical protein